MEHILSYIGFINEEKNGDGFTVYSYDEVKQHWVNSNFFKTMKPDEVLIFVNGRESSGILKTKFRLNNIKFRKADYYEYDFIIKSEDSKILFKKPKKHIVKSFVNITKLDLQKIVTTFDVKLSSQVGWSIDESISNIMDKLKLNYPLGFKNIPPTINLFRYLDVEDVSEIKQHKLGVHYVTRQTDITHEFLDSINANPDHDGYIVEIETSKSQIDVNETIINNLLFPDENEITLKEKANYKVVNVEKFVG